MHKKWAMDLKIMKQMIIKNKNTVINKVNLAENNVNIDNVNLNRKKIEDKKVIDTKDYIFIPKGDKGLFKINKNENNKPGFLFNRN